MANLLEVKDKVQRILSDFVGGLQLDPQGRFSFQLGSARVFVSVHEFGKEGTWVHIAAPTNFAVKASPELFKHVATQGDQWVFGHLSAREDDEGVMLLLSHSLLGDYLDPEELKTAVGAIASTADTIDDELKKQFGGRTFHEE